MVRIERIHWYLLTGATLCLLTAGVLVTVTRGHFLVALAPLGAALLIGTVSLLLQREARRMVEQDHVLLTISEGLATRLDLGDLLDHIVSTILQSVPLADKCVIHLLDERGRRLFPRYSSRPDWQRILGMPANRGIAGQALSERRTVVVNDVRREREFLPLHSSPELRALMVAPLHAHGKPLGTISLNSKRPGAFTRRDELLVTALAAQASAAIYQSQLYAASQRETHHVEAIINNLDDGLVVLDAEGRVLRYNPSLAHILGVDPARIIGRRVDPRSRIEGLRLLAHLVGERPGDLRQPYERQVEIDEPVHAILRVQVSPVLDHEGNWGQIVVLRDETEERSLVRARTGLIAAAACELGPPLESIRGYATLLMAHRETLPPTAGTWVTHIHEQATRLERYVDDLADLGAADLGELALGPERVDLATLIDEAASALAPLAARKGAKVAVQMPAQIPRVLLDGDRMRHALLNLGENAVHRAVPGGTIAISVDATAEEVTVTLADDGTPIPREAQARISQGPFRMNGASPDDPAGTGLWLYVSRRIIEAHGGHLWMPENGARGARFRFILPLTPPAAVAGSRRQRPPLP
ncbi:MAG TPA: GAF domain-containing protein [Chloroflexi bacterium]|jgi:PAS domain S-box-containing protein|nr:GAF domain-containing protein [Chloroflexota bacterium]